MPHEAAARLRGRTPVAPLGYTPRNATGTVLHQVVRELLESFLATTTRADPSGLPTFRARRRRGREVLLRARATSVGVVARDADADEVGDGQALGSVCTSVIGPPAAIGPGSTIAK